MSDRIDLCHRCRRPIERDGVCVCQSEAPSGMPDEPKNFNRFNGDGYVLGDVSCRAVFEYSKQLRADAEKLQRLNKMHLEHAEKHFAEAERNRQDAERYRFLKTKLATLHDRMHFCNFMNWHPQHLEPNIDAAIDKAKEGK